jgi:hypothetical protein
MARDIDATLIRPDGQVERLDGGHLHPPASYAPIVSRFRRGLPADPPDRRARPRLPGEPWRGRLIDSQR